MRFVAAVSLLVLLSGCGEDYDPPTAPAAPDTTVCDDKEDD